MNCAVCASELPPGALFCGECGSSASAAPRTVVDQRVSDTSVLSPISATPVTVGERAGPGDASSETGHAGDGPGLTRDGPTSAAGEGDEPGRARTQPATEAYLVRFSTGETAAISGAALIGRNPAPQPGELIPTMIPLSDEGRSVSKTHLEIGVTEGRLWVSDRFSSNGSMRVEPDGYRRRLEPGRRYLVDSGTRIAIGEQWVEFVRV